MAVHISQVVVGAGVGLLLHRGFQSFRTLVARERFPSRFLHVGSHCLMVSECRPHWMMSDVAVIPSRLPLPMSISVTSQSVALAYIEELIGKAVIPSRTSTASTTESHNPSIPDTLEVDEISQLTHSSRRS